jgi:hypothetical protein
MNGFIVAFILAGGIGLCISGFSKKGLPLNHERRITGRPAKIIGIISLLLSVAAACAWLALGAAVR